MAIKQEVVVTCLPNGYADGGQAMLSILFSPRLSGARTLNPFVFDDWTQRAWELYLSGFDVFFGDRRVRFTGNETDTQPRHDLWERLFPPSTYVRSFKVENVERHAVSSYPVQNVVGFAQEKLTKVATLAPNKALDAQVLIRDNNFGKIAPPAKIDQKVVGGDTEKQMKQQLAGLMKGAETKKLDIRALPNVKPDPSMDFYRAVDYYSKSNQKRLETKVPGQGAPDKRLDFHQMVGLLGNYPQLQRLLAIVIDINIELPDDVPSQGILQVMVRPRWDEETSGPGPTFVSPRTMTNMAAFKAQPRPKSNDPSVSVPMGPQLVNGKLNLANKFTNGQRVFDLTQIDPDGAAFSLKRFASRLTREMRVSHQYSEDVPGPPEYKAEPDTPLVPPSLRSPGLSLSRAGRAAALAQSLERSFAYNRKMLSPSFFPSSAAIAKEAGGAAPGDPAPKVQLYADDLVRGYAIDIYDEQIGEWFPLCTRVGEARFLGKGPITEPITQEDGWISPAVTKAPPKSGLPQKELEIHETMFRWGNWSLVTPRPGKTVTPAEEAQKIPNTAQTDFPLEVEYQVPKDPIGPLPILRYGRSYRARARVVDLAGNATPFGTSTDLDQTTSTKSAVFDRLEPGPPPVLIMRHLRTVAESLERMVIRSKPDTLDAATTPSQRHVISPKIDQFSAELHGMFDEGLGMDTSLNTYQMIRVREKGAIDEKDGEGFVHPTASPDPGNYGQPYFNVDAINFNVENGGLAGAPYLPDPLCHGAAFVGLPGDEGQSGPVTIPMANVPWPESEPFRLRLNAGNESGNGFTAGVLEMYVPKAEVFEVDYSSYHDDNSLAQLGLMRWIAEAAEQPETDGSDDEHERRRYSLMRWINGQAKSHGYVASGTRPSAMQYMQRVARESRNPRFWKKASAEEKHLAQMVGGTHMMVMPSRKLVLVHAVRQPLQTPEFGDGTLIADRSPGRPNLGVLYGRTFAKLRDNNLQYHRKSTGMIEVIATWTDVLDYIDTQIIEGSPVEYWYPTQELPKEEIVYRYDPGAPDTKQRLFSFRHEFHDTKYREVSYTMVATTRFKEYFVDNETVSWSESESKPLPPSPELLGDAGVVPESEKVIVPASERQANPQLGSTYVKGVHYTMDYDAGTISRIGNAIPIDTDVRVEYISPSLTVGPGPATGKTILNTARPEAPKISFIVPAFKWESDWSPTQINSSRQGRTLRIYMERSWWSSGDGEMLGVVLQNNNARLSRDNQYVTRMGLDPIWRSKPSSFVTTSAAFPERAAAQGNLTLEELRYTKVAVAGHEVGYDMDRRLWFADIVVATPSYFPFIRLALARYQPNSIPNAHLSRVVTANFIQLAPDRFASISIDQKSRIATVSVTGRSYTKVDGRLGPAKVDVTIESRRPEVDDPYEQLGWIPLSSAQTLQPSVVNENMCTWSGQVQLPFDYVTERYRLVVREYEMILTGKLLIGTLPQKGARLVYADAIELQGNP